MAKKKAQNLKAKKPSGPATTKDRFSPETLEEAVKLLLFLYDSQVTAWDDAARKQYSSQWYPSASNASKAVHSKFTEQGILPITKEEVRQALTVQVDMHKRPFMFLPPLEKNPEFLPVLYLPRSAKEWKDKAYVYRVALYRSGDKPYDTTGLLSLGLRFEGLHGQGNGRHDFWHAQIVGSFPKIPVELSGCPTWFPETVPSIPTYASCPVTSLLCVVASLYGGRILQEFLKHSGVSNGYAKKVKHLCPNA